MFRPLVLLAYHIHMSLKDDRGRILASGRGRLSDYYITRRVLLVRISEISDELFEVSQYLFLLL